MKEWFTPCDRCQEKIEKLWGHLGLAFDGNIIRNFPELSSRELCSKCLSEPERMLSDANIILGNKDYDPPIELSRRWDISDERNPETINLTEAESAEIYKEFGHTVYQLPHWLLVKKNTLKNPTPYSRIPS
jgi:hypothetical protein